MKTVHTQLLDIMTDYVSSINARSLVRRALEKCSGREGTITPENRNEVLACLRAASHLFVSRDQQAEMFERIEALFARRDALSGQGDEVITITHERDIVVARSRARAICESIGASPSATHKVATVVSELARNIVSYTRGGSIELRPRSEQRSILVCARDAGPGIRDLDAILAGEYRSSTGLGLGIAGSKRLSSSFQIRTGHAGTTIEAALAL